MVPIHSSTPGDATGHWRERPKIEMARRMLIALVAWLGWFGPLLAQEPAPAVPATVPRVVAVTARHGMAVAQEARAARIGVEFLQRGGNAVDAAVAVGFALAVTYPRAGNIGGGAPVPLPVARPMRMRACARR